MPGLAPGICLYAAFIRRAAAPSRWRSALWTASNRVSIICPKVYDLPMAPETKTKIVAMIVGSAVIMQQLDSTVITTALPQMAISLHTDPVRLSVAVTAYILSLAVVHSGERLGRRPLRRPHRVSRRDRAVHARLDPVRAEQQYRRTHRGAGAAGAGRLDDGPGRAARPVPQHRQGRSDPDDGLSAGAGAVRSGARPADRRLHHHLFLLALDFPRQRAARHSRHRAGDDLLRESQGRRPAAPAGLARLRAHRRVAVLHHERHRGDRPRPQRCHRSNRPVRARHGARRAGAAASAAHAASGARHFGVSHSDIPHQHHRRLAVPRRRRHFGVSVAAVVSGRVRHVGCGIRQHHLRDRRRLDDHEGDGAADPEAVRLPPRHRRQQRDQRGRRSRCAPSSPRRRRSP